ncbi:hypothetical protein BDW22DRAFT_1360742 [Trametopsis cervina]|nr:hypothetical protein BDW22DRAFT_1360742 [Trametopsis cervina]
MVSSVCVFVVERSYANGALVIASYHSGVSNHAQAIATAVLFLNQSTEVGYLSHAFPCGCHPQSNGTLSYSLLYTRAETRGRTSEDSVAWVPHTGLMRYGGFVGGRSVVHFVTIGIYPPACGRLCEIGVVRESLSAYVELLLEACSSYGDVGAAS